MKRIIILLLACAPLIGWAQLKTDSYPTSAGNVEISPVGHGSLMISFNGTVIHIDPYSSAGDYGEYPKADLILITHEHGDHYDKYALETIIKPETYVITNTSVGELYDRTNKILKNGDDATWNSIGIRAVPAYNIVHVKDDGVAYHPQGVGNGYVLTFGDFRVYIAGDTEPIPEMSALAGVDVAFLPKNLPYTMSDEEFVEAAKMVKPKVLYPYHYSKIDRNWLREQLPDLEIK